MGLGSYTVNQRKLARSVADLKMYIGATLKRLDKIEGTKKKLVKAASKELEKKMDGWILNKSKTLLGLKKRVDSLEEQIGEWR
jgi:hypothetical protein